MVSVTGDLAGISLNTNDDTNKAIGYQQTALDALGQEGNKKARRTGLLLGLLDHVGRSETKLWCPEEDSNLHSLRNTDLNRARLPIPPSGQRAADLSGREPAVNAHFNPKCDCES